MGISVDVMDRGSPVLIMQCREHDNPVTRSVSLAKLDLERLKFLWEKLSPFKVLFNDFVRDDLKAFVNHFITVGDDGQIYPAGILYDVDDVGIFFMNEIRPNDSAQVHFVFWDRIYSGREELCREMARLVMDKFHLHKLVVEWPVYASLSMRFMENIGFVNEGRKREAILSDGKWQDVMMFGLLKTDLDAPVHAGNHTYKRRVCYKCGKTYTEAESKKEMANHGA